MLVTPEGSKPLIADGAFKLVLPGDKRPQRWVQNLNRSPSKPLTKSSGKITVKPAHTRILMLSSAVFMAALGLAATFAPEVFLYPRPAPPASILAAEAAGALYLGFAVLNWMAKDNAIGGMYSRPVALGNLLHFFAVAMTLLRLVAAGNRQGPMLVVTLIYVAFAVWFGVVVFGKSPSLAAKLS